MKSFIRTKGKERTDYLYKVYRMATKLNPNNPPFPPGCEKIGFSEKRVLLQCQGGFYEGPTIAGLIQKIITAAEMVDEQEA